MHSYYNIHGLPVTITAHNPLVLNLMTAELKHFKVSKPMRNTLRIRFSMLPRDTGKAYGKDFLRKNFNFTRYPTAQYYRRNLIQSVTNIEKKEIETSLIHEPRLFPDPAYYLCISEPLSPWLKKKGLFFLHAGCISKNGKGLLIVGNSGAGKSTLTLSAIRGGFKFLSDEQPLLSIHNGKVIANAFPRRIRLDRLPASLFPELRPVLKASKAERLVFDARKIWPESLSKTPCLPKTLVFPNFQSKGRFHLKKIHPAAALAKLMQDEYLVWYQNGPWKDLSRRHLELLQQLAENTRAFEMTYSVKDILKIPALFERLLCE